MEYISYDEFEKQPFKVRKVLIKYHEKYHGVRCDSTPIYCETELRKCIEDKTKCRVCVFYLWDCKKINVKLVRQLNEDKSRVVKSYIINSTDVIQAYWETLIIIIKQMCENRKKGEVKHG